MSRSTTPSSASVSLALMLDDVQQAETILADFLASIDTETEVHAEKFPNTTTKYGEEFTEVLLYFLEDHDYLRPTATGWRLETSRSACVSLLMESWYTKRILEQAVAERDRESFDLVCTMPRRDDSIAHLEPADFEMRQITSAILTLCRNSERTLTIVSPFFESEGVEWILPGVEHALDQGIQVRIASRELSPGGPNQNALAELHDYAEHQGGDLTIYDYYESKDNSEEPLYTLHSKLVISDQRAAYVGSANFTKYGFNENFEVGVVVRGESVSRLSTLVERIIEASAREVIST